MLNAKIRLMVCSAHGMREKYPLVLLKESEELILKTEVVKSLTCVSQPDLISEIYNFCI